MKNECLFCKIINKEVPAKILYEDDVCLVFLDAYPHTDGHTLVIPKKHYDDIYDVPDEVLTHMISVGKNIAGKLMKKLDKKGITFLINYGDSQAIKHIHLHLLPNFDKEEHNLSNEEVFSILKEG